MCNLFYRLGVTNYPRKEKRKKTKEEHVYNTCIHVLSINSYVLILNHSLQFSVGVVEWNEASQPHRFLIQRRPVTGDRIPFCTCVCMYPPYIYPRSAGRIVGIPLFGSQTGLSSSQNLSVTPATSLNYYQHTHLPWNSV